MFSSSAKRLVEYGVFSPALYVGQTQNIPDYAFLFFQ